MAKKDKEEVKNEVATTESNAIAATSFLGSEVESLASQEDFRKDFDQEDLITPRIRVVQSTSPQVKKQKPEYIEEAEAGMFYNTASKELYDGAEGILVVPCYFNKEFIEWVPQNKGGGLVKRWGEDDGFKTNGLYREEKGKWVNDQTEIVRTANYYVILIDPKNGAMSPAILTLGGTQYKKSRGWATMISAADYKKADGTFITPPPFFKVYQLTTIPESNDSGDWYGIRITQHGTVENLPNGAVVWKAAKEFREMVLSGQVVAHADQEDVAEHATDV